MVWVSIVLTCALLTLAWGRAFDKLRACNSADIVYRMRGNTLQLFDVRSGYMTVLQASGDNSYRTFSSDPRTTAWCLSLINGFIDWDKVDVLPGQNPRRLRHLCEVIMVVMPKGEVTDEPTASLWLTSMDFFELRVNFRQWISSLNTLSDQYSVITMQALPLKKDDSEAQALKEMDDLETFNFDDPIIVLPVGLNKLEDSPRMDGDASE